MVTTQNLLLQPSDGMVFIVEASDNLDFETLRTQLLGFPGTGGDCEIEKLFESENGDLARFAIVGFPNAGAGISVSPFDLAYKLKDEFNFASVTPSLVQEPPDHLTEWDVDCSENDTSDDHTWHLKQMRVFEAWDLSKGKGICIGHIDSGVTDHPEIRGSFDIEKGKNFVKRQEKPWPEEKPWDFIPKKPCITGLITGHGTMTCSLAVAPGTGLQKFLGTAPEAKVVPYRAFDGPPVLNPWNAGNIAKAIEAASEQCQVISMSLGGLSKFSCVEEAIKKATEKGIICVAAAGNFARWVTYPGWDKNCITVAGTTFDCTAWKGSCRGSAVTISAPAYEVYCAKRRTLEDPEDLVEPGEGTSLATACVAGIAALWLSYHGRDTLINKYEAKNLTRVFRNILSETATVPDGWDTNNFGAGIVNAAKLLSADLPSVAEVAEEIELFAQEVEEFEPFEAQVRYAFSEQGFDPEKIDDEFIQRYGNEILFLDLYRLQSNKFAENAPEMSMALKSALAKIES